jgi:twitching motility protein PilT
MTPHAFKLGELLVQKKLLGEAQLDMALKQQRQLGGTLGEHLLLLGLIPEEILLETLSQQTGFKNVNLAKQEISAATLKLVRHDTVTSRRVLPIAVESNKLLLGMMDPSDQTAIQEVAFQSSKVVQPVLLSARQFHQALESFDAHGYGDGPLRLEVELRGSPRTDDLHSMLQTLVAWRGQDLHLSDGAVPAVRVDGEMRRLPLRQLDRRDIATLVGSILTVEQKRRVQEDGELDFAYQGEGVGRFRCNIYRQRGSLAFTARVISEHIPTLPELGIPSFMHDLALKKQGLILVTGPNGHGKSTTLAALIDVINRERYANIITIEDPIEFIHHHQSSNVNQREVGADTKSFAEGLKRVFRQNPDVIVIGEMRDLESISIALTAAETGHLVLASMHALNSTGALNRVLDAFPAEQQRQVRVQLAESLLCVFSQRLVKAASGRGRVLAYEKLTNSMRVGNAIRDGQLNGLRAMIVPVQRTPFLRVVKRRYTVEHGTRHTSAVG